MLLATLGAIALPVCTPVQGDSYSIFHPVPEDELRDMVADRPDTTESPLTVDAGHLQFEVSLTDWTRDRSDDTITAVAANAKIGLTETTDLQLVFDSYTWFDGDNDSFGDVQLRLKWNLWGNDGEDTALALFPYIKIPTDTRSSNGEWEGGLIVPYATELENGVGLGLMGEIDLVDDGTGHLDAEFLHSAVLGFELTDRLGAFAEYVGIASEDDYLALGTIGGTYEVHSEFVLDAGVRLGLNSDAEDVGVFLGFTARY